MGMSASHARLIAFTARMSDPEYEAQQINQQRVTLSNQMNAVYEAMMDMDVPTPPSKLDPQFLNTVYRAKLGSDTITIRPNGAGKMAAYKTVKNGNIVSDAGGQNVGKVADLTSFLKATEYTSDDFKYWDPAKLTMHVTPEIYSSLADNKRSSFTEVGTGSYEYKTGEKDAQGNDITDKKEFSGL